MASKLSVAALIWSASILLSRVIGLVREAVLGRTLGVSTEADLYQAAFVLPDFLNYLLAGGALSVVLIPIFVGHLQRDDEAAFQESVSSIARILFGAVSLLTLVAYFFLSDFLVFWFPGFAPAEQQRLLEVTQVVLPAQIFHVTGGLFSAALLARDQHALPALAPLLYTGCIVLGGLWGGAEAGAMGFAWGVLVGSILGPFGLPWIAWLRWTWSKRDPEAASRGRTRWFHPDLRRYVLAALPIMLGFSIVMLDEWIFKRLASGMGSGAVAEMSYARSIMRVPMGVFGLAMGAASFPLMSRQAASGDRKALQQTLSQAVRRVLILAFAAQVLFSVVGEEIAAVIYGGRVSERADQNIAYNLALMSIALGAWSTHNLFARVFYALGRTWIPSVVGSGCMLLAYPVYVWAGEYYGTYGLSLVGAAAMTVYVLILAFWARRTLGEALEMLGFLGPALAAVGVAVAAGRSLAAWISLTEWVHMSLENAGWGASALWWSALLGGALEGALSLVVYLGILALFRVPELKAVGAILGRRLRRS